MIYPVNRIAITQGYHLGKSLDFGWYGQHNQPILACDDGSVYRIEKQPKGGNVIYLLHTNGVISAYAHLNTICVKKGQKVKLGQQIATMGKTGKVTAEHLHFGLYSKGKNIYGSADLDPFKYCFVYPNQKVCQSGNTKNYLSKFKYYDDKKIWTTGVYKLKYEKYLRKSHNLLNNIYKVKECNNTIKPYLNSIKPNAKAMLTTKEDVRIVEIYEQGKRIWGKLNFKDKPYWLVLCNADGKPQATKLS